MEHHYCTTEVEPHFKRVAIRHNQYYEFFVVVWNKYRWETISTLTLVWAKFVWDWKHLFFLCSWFTPSQLPLEHHYCTTDVELHFKRVANGHNQYYGQNLSGTANIRIFYVPDLHHHSCHGNTTTALLTQNHTLRGLSTENQSASWVTLSRTTCRCTWAFTVIQGMGPTAQQRETKVHTQTSK